ncbi:Acyl-CoA synthetase (AMP-forming)/AMP-acid ligase II [Marinobacter daqiaonensis]|uniref:Acyl-CoA synthetase (AMP-forming)/AMP-acid ligase II n=1 Tax=Marinobacter daqiaonensis TaxID=650891 RepID=A0A1I6IMT5_9GAMM|nr:class I adenylate-forming enzyme family protein [Marinobacter daqiaonensis]SFR68028.1 Acyl-CoA synthetase (AMP-forming)/AMP-acid ligase II [Marinobacter daqiaonensis]
MILHKPELIEEYTRKGYWGHKTLFERFQANCQAHPDREAVVDPPNREELVGTPAQRLTWAEFGRGVDATAAELVRRGFGKDDIVVAQLPNVWELAMLYLAAAKAGGLLSALPMQWRRKDVGYVREMTGARFYISAETFHGFDYQALGQELGFENYIGLRELTEIARGEPGEAVNAAVDANDIFTLCWTSGTEADPKGCPMSHNNWEYLISLVFTTCGLEKGDRMLCVAPLVNMTAVGVNYVPWLAAAGTLVLHHPITPEILLRQLTEERIQYTILVPAMLNMIAKLPNVDQLDLSSIRTITTGSAPPSAWSMQEFKRRWDIDIVNIWGQNEGTSLVAGPADVPELDMRVDHLPWWGREGVEWPSGIYGVEVKILGDGDEEITEPGGIGELVYRSPGLFAGYFRRPDLTERAFTEEGFFRTGDLFIVQDDRHVGFYDRKKDMVIRGGFNISSVEVENAVLGFDRVQDVAVIPQPDDIMGERVCICVVAADDHNPPTLEEINDHLREQGMSVYKLPEKMKLIDAIPRNPVGKILKKELRTM